MNKKKLKRDYHFERALTDDEAKEVETAVNKAISANLAATEEMVPLEEANRRLASSDRRGCFTLTQEEAQCQSLILSLHLPVDIFFSLKIHEIVNAIRKYLVPGKQIPFCLYSERKSIKHECNRGSVGWNELEGSSRSSRQTRRGRRLPGALWKSLVYRRLKLHVISA